MKKAILSLFVCCIALLQAQAQVDYKSISKLTFFGVDFSEVKVYGALESPQEFRYAFEGINILFQTEPKKYNIYKYFNKTDMKLELTTTLKRIENMDLENLKVANKGDLLTTAEIETYIKNFDTGNEQGYGAILIAELIDKPTNHATYNIVIFNIETKEIIKSKQVRTKGRGFGLRNFWARSVLDALKVAAK